MRKSHKPYEKPALVPLCLDPVLAQNCNVGSAASGGNCMTGTSPMQNCISGATASHCPQGGSPG